MGTITKQIIFISILLLFINNCANQLPPGGGEEDKIPPEVTEIYPLDGTTNFDNDYIEIDFSEYVDKRSFKDALFISPNIEGRINYDWTGTSVEVEFKKDLDKDITYTVTVGTDLVDRNNNRMNNSFTFSFSTGNRIDRGMISGKVYSDDTEGILIYAYKLDSVIDTLIDRKPNYVTQTGKDGNFQLVGLGKAQYRLFAVKDEFRDLIYNLDQDLIGMPNLDVTLDDRDSTYSGLFFRLFKADTTAPRLLKGIMTDEKHILVTLTEKINKELISSDNFYLYDSTVNKKSNINFIYNKYGKAEEIVLIPEEKPITENSIYLIAKILKDSVDNTYENDFLSVTVSDRPDTIPVKIVATDPPLRNAILDFKNPNISFYMDDAFKKENLTNNISFTDTLNKDIRFNISFDDDATLVITTLKELLPEKDYVIKLYLKGFPDAEENTVDTLYEFKFKTISGLDFTGVSGKLLNVDFTMNPVLVIESTGTKQLKYQIQVSQEDFNFERVEAGKYILWCYLDIDSNNSYTYGWPQPIEYSERFDVYADTLNLKPRWVVTDVLFKFE